MDETVYERLVAAAIRFISYRPRSEKEIRDFCAKTLKRHHTTAPLVVDQVVKRLGEYGYVDDDKFTQWWVSQRTTFKPKGKRVIVSELRGKGISPERIDACLNQSSGETVSETELAKQSIVRKMRLWSTLPTLARKQKMISFLSRRGFDSETVYSVVDDLLEKE